ncbi:glutathione S-transferase [Apiospora saccharicola]
MLTILRKLHLLTENTPNGKKVQILLEELHATYGTSWKTHLVDLETGEQKKDWFLKLNPNGRIPVLIDTTKSIPFAVMESAAILIYLQELYDAENVFGFEDPIQRSEVLQWLFFWHAAAPLQGQTRHFVRDVKEPMPCFKAKC